METRLLTNSRRAVQDIPTQQVAEYLSFTLGGEEYGVDILRVQEIRGFELPTRMITAPRHVLGVLNLRGVIVPIFDFRIKFGIADCRYDSQTVTIVLNIADRVVGMVVDSVSDVLELNESDIKPAPDLGGDLLGGHVIGLSTIMQGEKTRTLILLDIEQLMTSPELGLISPSTQLIAA